MDKMANAAEVIEKLAISKRLHLLKMARGCKDLNELVAKFKALVASP